MTAVEWLKSKIIEDIRLDDLISGYYSKEQYKRFLLNKIEYALEMEKEQIINAYLQDRKKTDFVGCLKNMDKAEKYYSDTY